MPALKRPPRLDSVGHDSPRRDTRVRCALPRTRVVPKQGVLRWANTTLSTSRSTSTLASLSPAPVFLSRAAEALDVPTNGHLDRAIVGRDMRMPLRVGLHESEHSVESPA